MESFLHEAFVKTQASIKAVLRITLLKMSSTTTETAAESTSYRLRTSAPLVQYLPASASIGEITAAIAVAGGVVIKNAVSPEIIHRIE
jgi:hypothetical protein